eukprot:CAMPEP_0181076364 /NCGR_PEP_ID=MMETSP1071-20121207/379_1 /TAXON_ID=35127 /ORGANISM="Thalassiosira sp., Strain NH16" /LENGTH=543 /DNA_ID=CAMNT_0023157539 /DNA_START=119 /DNA_END=1750 /DNA_ORIENTATION=+
MNLLRFANAFTFILAINASCAVGFSIVLPRATIRTTTRSPQDATIVAFTAKLPKVKKNSVVLQSSPQWFIGGDSRSQKLEDLEGILDDIVDKTFEGCDDDGSNGLDAQELVKFFNKLDGQDISLAMAHSLVTDFDKDENKQLDRVELGSLARSLVESNALAVFVAFAQDKETDPALTPNHLRRALRAFGVDMSSEKTKDLLKESDANGDGRLQLLGFVALIKQLPVTKFWLKYDPTGRYRLLRLRLQTISRAGCANGSRLAHYSVGVSAILFGVRRYLLELFTPFVPCSRTNILVEGGLHIACALSGLPRIDWRKGATPSRRMLMAPAFFINGLIVLSTLTNFSQPANKALILAQSPIMRGYIVSTVVLNALILKAQWVTGGKVNKRSGAPLDTKRENLMAGFFTLTFGMGLVLSSFGTFAFSSSFREKQLLLLKLCPNYGESLDSTTLLVLLLNNTASLFATLTRDKAMSDMTGVRIFTVLAWGLIYITIKNVRNTGVPAALNLVPGYYNHLMPLLGVSLISFLVFLATDPRWWKKGTVAAN